MPQGSERGPVDDPRGASASTYDLAPHYPNDIPFYLAHLQSPSSRVLELGCGTGRVSVALARCCAFLQGLDHSASMVGLLREKARAAGFGETRIRARVADITDFDLAETFDLVIAPFRVMQNLETDEQLDGMFEAIARHLAPNGRCILNAFHPNRSPERMKAEWVAEGEVLEWEVETEHGLLRRYDRRAALRNDPLVLYPELIDRLYVNGRLVSESVLRIAMRCFYPDELVEMIEAHGFRVVDRWGGYEGEPYGEGSELVVAFEARGA
jgi:SAM-dependent methyltransferase